MTRGLLVILLTASLASAQPYIPPPDNDGSQHTDGMQLPRVGRRVDPIPKWEELVQKINKGRVQSGTFALRPAANAVTPSAAYIVTDCATTACTAGGNLGNPCLTQSDGAAWTTKLCASAGGGVGPAGPPGPPPQVFFGTDGNITAGAVVYAGLQGQVDSREAAVQGPVNSTARAWNNLRCKTSAVPGGTGITVTFRKGACGALADTGLACTIASGATTCTGEPVNAAQSVASAGHCVDASIVHTASGNAVQVSCSVEQTS